MKSKISAQISLEAAIVLPIVMIIIAAMLSISMYIHDVIVIKSYGYSLITENRDKSFYEFKRASDIKLNKMPLFVTKIKTEVKSDKSYYQITVWSDNKSSIKWLDIMFDEEDKKRVIRGEKSISKELMRAVKAIYYE